MHIPSALHQLTRCGVFVYCLLPGISILLIPFSFDFVDALCIAAVLGFTRDKIDELNGVDFRQFFFRGGENKLAVPAAEDEQKVDCETGSLSSLSVLTKSMVANKGLRPGHGRLVRRHTMMHISSAPQGPVSMERQVGADAMQPSTNGPLQMYGPHRILKGLSRRSGSLSLPRPSLNSSGLLVKPDPSLQVDDHSTSLHWALAVAATLQLVLSAVSNQAKT